MNKPQSILKRQQIRGQERFFEQFKSKPFWIWDKEPHKIQHAISSGRCCFNHIIGLPVKNSKKMRLFDYEQEIFNALQVTKHLWIKKATGLGITEFMLRYIAWLCLRDDKLKGSQMCIVTGPRIDLAITLVERIKGLFPTTMRFDTKETVVQLNGVKIEAFPSHHLDAMRGLPNVSFILLDEADFFPPGQQQDARNVSERYIAKSNPYIVMVSTPNRPFGLFEQIEKENQSIYHRIHLPYTVGLNKIYTVEEIQSTKQSPSFEREYNLSYIAGLEGGAFHEKDIDKAIKLGKQLGDPTTLDNAILRRGNPRLRETRVLAADPGFGSSSYGLCLLGLFNSCIQVLHADELGPRPDFNNAISKTLYLYDFYECKCILVDAANSAVISALKRELGERTDYLNHIAQLKTGWHIDSNDIGMLKRHMRVIPVSFGAGESKSMLTTAQVYLSQGGVAIHPKFDKLIMALRTATVARTDGALDKELTQFDDTFDAFRMGLRFFKSEKR